LNGLAHIQKRVLDILVKVNFFFAKVKKKKRFSQSWNISLRNFNLVHVLFTKKKKEEEEERYLNKTKK